MMRTLIMKKNKRKEEDLQISICEYLDLQYPNVIYTSDLSGIKLPVGLAVKASKQRTKNYKIPDLLILHPNNQYHGLILELKKSRSALYLKDNVKISNAKHIRDQLKTLLRLSDIGYKACFSCGFDETKQIIDEYFK